MKHFPIIVLATILVFGSCKKDKERSSVLGSWQCEENSEQNGYRSYQVSITRSPIIDTVYVISNFYKLGISEESEVYFYIDKKGDLIIPNAFVQGKSIYGNGTVEEDYSKITWSYFVNDGLIQEAVEAIYY